ncbi:DUF2272 domain-containing protein [Rhizobium ruizarguesonis]|uniref:DUF2272 domain-containing protein n=1 Tax=Rhizobium ruizarguesonis TaxID=2081791 RepID=UPI0010321659|nr:DUF2272 domain-containing protein [Rhizobium ruizarguesonis]TBD47128.1 DUF2272 domain-containing protein [Rhizobium ruizarguesonis]
MKRLLLYCRDLSYLPDEPRFHFSGIFISWCIRQAGFTEAEFPKTPAHCDYVRAGLRSDRSSFAFKAVPYFSLRPERGDIITFCRDHPTDLANLGANAHFVPLESIICLNVTETTVVGAVANWPLGQIGYHFLALGRNGYLAQRSKNSLLSVMRIKLAF